MWLNYSCRQTFQTPLILLKQYNNIGSESKGGEVNFRRRETELPFNELGRNFNFDKMGLQFHTAMSAMNMRHSSLDIQT